MIRCFLTKAIYLVERQVTWKDSKIELGILEHLLYTTWKTKTKRMYICSKEVKLNEWR